MKTLTLAEFETLVARQDWRREQAIEIVDGSDRYVEEYDADSDSLSRIVVPHAWGYGLKTSVLDGITISHTETFQFDRYQPETFSAGSEGLDDVWAFDGLVVLDEHGDPVDTGALACHLSREFSAIDYSELQIAEATDLDVDEDSGMETFLLTIDNAPDLRFTGERIAAASTSESNASPNYSGQTGRWTELALYRTKGGKFVCHQVGRTLWQGERDRYSGQVCETEEEVKAFFGHRWLAKELYEEAGISTAVEVE